MANNFLQALGQGLRGWGATTSQENFNTYNQQNQFRAEQEERKRQLVLGLLIKGVENGTPGAEEALNRWKQNNPDYGDVPNVGLGVDAQKLREEKRQFDIETEETRKNRERIGGIVGGLLGRNQQEQSSGIPPVVQSPESFVPQPSEVNPDFEGRSYKPAPHLTGDEQQFQKYVADSTPIPEGATPRERALVENYRAGSPYAPSSTVPSPAAQETAQELQARIPGVDPKRAYEAAIVISQLGDKDTGQRVKDFAEYLAKNKEDQRKWEREQITIDDFGIGKDHDLDREFVINEDGSRRWISTDEANRIRNKGREASAPKVTVNPENVFDKEAGSLRAKSLADQESLTKKYIHIAGEVGGLTEAMRGMEGGAPAEVASWLGRFFPNSSIGDYKSADEMISSLATRLATQVRAEGSGQTSNYEMAMYLQAIPRLATTEAGRELMKLIADRFAERKAQEYDIYLDMVQESYASGKKGFVSMEEYKKRTNALGHLITAEERDIAIKAAKDKNYRYRQIPTVKEGGNRRNGPVATPSKEQ